MPSNDRNHPFREMEKLARQDIFLKTINLILLVIVMQLLSILALARFCHIAEKVLFIGLFAVLIAFDLLWSVFLVQTKTKQGRFSLQRNIHIALSFVNSALYILVLGILYKGASASDVTLILIDFFIVAIFTAVCVTRVVPLTITASISFYTLGLWIGIDQLGTNRINLLFDVYSFGMLLYFSCRNQRESIESFIVKHEAIERQNEIAVLYQRERENNDEISLYKSIFEQSPLSIIVTDGEGSIITTSPYLHEISGYSKEDVMGKHVESIGFYENTEVIVDIYRALDAGKSWTGQSISRKKSGERYNESVIIFEIKDDAGHIRSRVAIKEDITEKVVIQKEVLERTKFITQLLELIPSPIFYTDQNDCITGVNKAYEDINNTKLADIIGRKLLELPWVRQKGYDLFQKLKKEAMESRTSRVMHLNMKSFNGVRFDCLFSISPYYLSDGSLGGILGIFTDITEIKEKEEALEIAVQRAEDAANAKSQFLANMSHEIRTPMNAVIGMSYLALQTELNDKQKDYILKIHRSATVLLGVVNDILDYSKIEAGKMVLEEVPFDLHTVILDVHNTLAHSANAKGLQLDIQIPFQKPYSLSGDPVKLGQVLVNLVGNGIKFTTEGKIRVDIRELRSMENGVELQFSVSDTGIGILEKEKDKLFNAFTQSDASTSRRYGGTGLGLTICKKIVEEMGGSIWVESEYEKGSTFFFTACFGKVNYFLLPDNERERLDHGRQNGVVVLNAATFRGFKILVVEDNELNQQIARELLEVYGAEVMLAGNGLEAVHMIMKEKNEAPFDLVLMDNLLPIMDGIEATGVIRKQNCQVPIIAMTARMLQEELDQCYHAGMNDHISKPIQPNRFYQTIQKWLFKTNTDNMNEVHVTGKIQASDELIIDGINTAIGSKRAANNRELYLELLKMFARKYENITEELERLRVSGSFQQLEQLAHSMKGASGNVGAEGLYEHFSELEKECRNHTMPENIKIHEDCISNEMKMICRSIHSFFQNRTLQEHKPDKVMDIKQISMLIHFLQRGNHSAIKLWDDIRPNFQQVYGETKANELNSQMMQYEFEKAKQLLLELL